MGRDIASVGRGAYDRVPWRLQRSLQREAVAGGGGDGAVRGGGAHVLSEQRAREADERANLHGVRARARVPTCTG